MWQFDYRQIRGRSAAPAAATRSMLRTINTAPPPEFFAPFERRKIIATPTGLSYS